LKAMLGKKLVHKATEEYRAQEKVNPLKGYDTVMGADLQVAKDHEKANTVKRPLVDLSRRSMCADCKQYIPLPEDKFPFWKTSTDELAFLGTGFPVYFTFLKRVAGHMFLMSAIIGGALFIQSNVLYGKLSAVNGHSQDDLSTFVIGTSYSVHAFRLFYGFDFGPQMQDSYSGLIILAQVFTVLFANYLTVSLLLKAA